MKGNLVNPNVSPSNLILDHEIKFSVNSPNHLLSSPCITSKRTHYSLLIIASHSLWIVHIHPKEHNVRDLSGFRSKVCMKVCEW